MSVLGKTFSGSAFVGAMMAATGVLADCEAVGNNGQSRLITTLSKSASTGRQCLQSAEYWARQGGSMTKFMNAAGSGHITINCGNGRKTVGYFSGSSVSRQRSPAGC